MKQNEQWFYYGEGFDSFGVNDLPVTTDLPEPGPSEALARVEAVSICASDVKMIRLGNDYPLFKNRDMASNPAVLGHELSLTIEKPGKNIMEEWPAGTRIGVQPDVYLDEERYCIGVNVDGGMARYVLLGSEVFASDNGSCAFMVDEHIPHATVAQTEPFACVEAAFEDHTRKTLKKDGKCLIYIADNCRSNFKLTPHVKDSELLLLDPYERSDALADLADMTWTKVKDVPAEPIDDVIILGNPEVETITALTECLAKGAIFCWLPEYVPETTIPVDLAKAHYHQWFLAGAISKDINDALDDRSYRYDYKAGGTLLISGGAGAMGRIHIMRALQAKNKPKQIIVLNRTHSRLHALLTSFASMADQNEVRLSGVALEEDDYRTKLTRLLDGGKADDIVVCAPGVEPVHEVIDFLSPEGLLVLFAGTKYGEFANLPLHLTAAGKLTISSSSGSSIQDQLKVLEKIKEGTLQPNSNVAAIGGFYDIKKALRAVNDGKYSGKVVLFPQQDFPLTPLQELHKLSSRLTEVVNQQGWTKKAEHELFLNPGEDADG